MPQLFQLFQLPTAKYPPQPADLLERVLDYTIKAWTANIVENIIFSRMNDFQLVR